MGGRKLRVVVYRDSDGWTAQCLEYDIASHAADFDTVVHRVTAAIQLEADFITGPEGRELEPIPPAPREFFEMFDNVHTDLRPINVDLEHGVDFRIAA